MALHKNIKKGLLATGLASIVLSAYNCVATSNQVDEIRQNSLGLAGEYFRIKYTPFILDEIVIKGCHQLYATAISEKKEWLHYGVPVQQEFEKPILAQCRELSVYREQTVSRIKELEANSTVIAAINKKDNLMLEALGYTITGFLPVILFGIMKYYSLQKNPTKPL